MRIAAILGCTCCLLLAATLGQSGGRQASGSAAHGEEPGRLQFHRGAIRMGFMAYGAILLDRDGFLWIGTTGGGVCRYDGYEKRFFTDRPGEISGTMVTGLGEDSEGKIWISTLSHGVSTYDKATGKFQHHRHDPEDPNSLVSDSLPFSPQSLFVDSKDQVWVGTKGFGLARLDQRSGRWARFAHASNGSASIGGQTVLSITEGLDGRIWVGTREGGLSGFDPKTQTWTRYLHRPGDGESLSGNAVSSLCVRSDGTIWVATEANGLNLFDPASGRFTRYLAEQERSQDIPEREIWHVFEDSKERVWVCHPSGRKTGLSLLDPKTGRFTPYAHSPRRPNSVSSNAICGVLEDPRNKSLWVLNFGGELDKNDPNAPIFTTWSKGADERSSLSDQMVFCFAEDRRERIWIGTARGGLNLYDPAKSEFRWIQPRLGDPESLANAQVTALTSSRDGKLWVGHWGGTLSLFDPDSGRVLRHYRHDPGDPHSLARCQRVKFVVEDKEDEHFVWVGTVGGGLNRLDLRTHRFRHYLHDPRNPKSLSSNTVVTIHDDGSGDLWIATYGGGLNRLDKATGEFRAFRHDPKDPTSAPSDTMYEVLRDRSGQLWVSSKRGIASFDEETESFRCLDRSRGLSSNVISSIAEDREGYLWMGTIDAGVMRFDPATRKAAAYYAADGLQGNSYFWTSRLVSKRGRIWFGGSNGVSRIDPTQLKSNTKPPAIVLTSFRSGGDRGILGTAPERLRSVTLDWRKNYFEFQFAALNFTHPESNTYAYRLDGRDEDWYFSGADPFGRYSGLTPGRYVLRLKGANNDGVWNDDGISIEIIVTTPFWQSWWFYTLACTVGFALVSLLGFQVIKLRREVHRRETAEQALRAGEEHLRTTLDSLEDAVVTTDGDLILTGANPAAERLFEARIEDLSGSPLSAILPWEVDVPVEHERDGELAEGPSNTHTRRYVDARGVDRVVEEGRAPILAARGRRVGWVWVIRDVTKERELEDQLRHSQKMDAIGQLAGGIAHDFNNLLTGIMGNAELLHEQRHEERESEVLLGEILRTSGRAADLTSQLLAFSRKGHRQRIAFSLHRVINETVELLKRSIDRRIIISCTYAAERDTIEGDPSQLQSALLNLGLNARDAMPEGGALRFRTRVVVLDEASSRVWASGLPAASYLEVQVTDTGVGMEQRIADRIFEPFFTTKKVGEGTGLGLASVYGCIRGHGGSLDVSSKVGAGTTFYLLLPLADVEVVGHAEDTSSRPLRGAGHIMVVDDEEVVRNFASRALTGLGYRVSAFADGVEALAFFEKNHAIIDVVILDIVMPQLGGEALFDSLQEIAPEVPILIATGFANSSLTEELVARGAVGLLPKPYGMDMVSKAVAEGMRRSRRANDAERSRQP